MSNDGPGVPVVDPDWEVAQECFLRALELAGHERTDFLNRSYAAHRDRPELRERVEQLLGAHQGPGLGIERWLVDLASGSRLRSTMSGPGAKAGGLGPLNTGTRLGAFRVLRLVGSGGMGEVYEAMRDDGQFQQRVAIKVLRPGYLAAELVQRFEREREILARLEHPSIVRIVDGGLVHDGRPFLVMEFVDGRSITDHCHQRQLTSCERLDLFVRVCSAVQYAHGQLIVHRDLKPSNILVTPSGDPKLLDFGIAKLMHGADEGASSEPKTRPHVRLMTPERAAPEQRRGEPVTTATDVYALGLLLSDLMASAIPRRLKKRLTDLDRIAAKAAHDSPDRRYASVGQLGEDVERYLGGRPIRARPDSLGYRARRFAARNRVPLVVLGAFTALLGSFGVVSARQADRIALERDAATHERATAESVVGILAGLFEGSNPVKVPGGDTMRVSTFIEDAAAAVEDIEDPAVQARLWETVATIHIARSEFARAEQLLARARDTWVDVEGEDSREAAIAQYQLAKMSFVAQKDGRNRPMLRAAVDDLVQVLPANDTVLIDSYVTLALATDDLAERRLLLDAADQTAASLDEHSVIPRASRVHGWASVELDEGRPDRALTLFEETVRLLLTELAPDHPHVTTVEGNVAAMFNQLGRFAEAETLQRAVLDRMAATGDTATMGAAVRTMNLGVSLANGGDLEESEHVLLRAQELLERLVDPQHPQVRSNLRNLAMVAAQRGRVDEAIEILEGIVAELEAAGELTGDPGYRAHLSRLYLWRGETERGTAWPWPWRRRGTGTYRAYIRHAPAPKRCWESLRWLRAGAAKRSSISQRPCNSTNFFRRWAHIHKWKRPVAAWRSLKGKPGMWHTTRSSSANPADATRASGDSRIASWSRCPGSTKRGGAVQLGSKRGPKA